ncbi:MAG: response regulator [Armatimonadetes bacterium]|nr:response regulator [Armatimonadota bacterium]
MSKPVRPRVLVVEDDVDTVEALRVLLEHEGYDVVTATDPNSGLEMAQQKQPDLIVLDVMMPSGTEGFHFVWKLRRDGHEEIRDVPIIVVSGIHRDSPLKLYPDQQDGEYGPYEYLPVQAFLDKPVEPEVLLEHVARLLEQKQAASGR